MNYAPSGIPKIKVVNFGLVGGAIATSEYISTNNETISE
jgi:hypothetical protein